MLGVLFYDVIKDGIDRVSLDFLTSQPSRLSTRIDSSGLASALWGTIWLMGTCAVFIIPVGVATAVYLEEYADNSRWYNRAIEVNIQNLAAVPSVVYGLLGLAFLVRGPLNLGRVVLAGALTLGLLVLPVVIIAGREAIRAVPPSIREGSMALGATKWQTIWKQVLPSSIPGHRDRRDPGAVARGGGDGAAAGRGSGRLHSLQPRRDALQLHGASDSDLRLDVGPESEVPGAGRGRDPRADGADRPHEQHRDLAAQPI